jgi:hypothetical protein
MTRVSSGRNAAAAAARRTAAAMPLHQRVNNKKSNKKKMTLKNDNLEMHRKVRDQLLKSHLTPSSNLNTQSVRMNFQITHTHARQAAQNKHKSN